MRIDMINGGQCERAIGCQMVRMVTLDHNPLPDCVGADEEEGEAIVYRRDQQGDIVLHVITGDPLTKIVTGEVRIIWADVTIEDVRTYEYEIAAERKGFSSWRRHEGRLEGTHDGQHFEDFGVAA